MMEKKAITYSGSCLSMFYSTNYKRARVKESNPYWQNHIFCVSCAMVRNVLCVCVANGNKEKKSIKG